MAIQPDALASTVDALSFMADGGVIAGGPGGGVTQRGGAAEAVEFFRRAKFGESGGTLRPTRPYKQIPPIRAAIDRKAFGLASMPMMISTSDDMLIESGPLYDLLEKPNPRMGRRQFWIASSGWLDLSGACHWVMLRSTWRGMQPTEIVPVGAWQMKPLKDRDGDLVGWKYRALGMRWDQAIDIRLDEVWTVSLDGFDPDDPFGFSSPLEAAGLAAAQIWKGDLANEASLDNGVEPGGVFTMEGTPTTDQIKDLREEIRERHTGAVNRRKHLLLYGGIKWQTVAASFSDMEFSELQMAKIIDCCNVLGVDPAAIGYYEGSNYAHAESAKASLWIDTILPRAEWLADEFERGVVARFTMDKSLTWRDALAAIRATARPVSRRQLSARGYQRAAESKHSLMVWFDDSRVPAIRKAQLERSKEGAVWIKDYLAPAADVIEALDLPIPIHEHQRIAYQPIGIMPVDAPLPGDEDPAGPLPPASPTEDPAATESDGDEEMPQQTNGGDKAWVARVLSDDDLARMQSQWRMSWAGLEQQARGKVSRHFMELRRQVLRKIDEIKPGFDDASKAVRTLDEVTVRNTVLSVLFDLVEANGKLRVSMRPVVRDSTKLGGQQSIDEAAIAQGGAPGSAPDSASPGASEKPPTFDLSNPKVVAAMERREIRITDINRTLRKQLAETIADGVEQGESTPQIAERVRTTFNFAQGRANTIARTEVGGAVEEARDLGRTQARVPAKSWLWSRKETGRPWHQATETATMANPVAQDDEFTIAQTGSRCRHPRGSGVAKDDVNCGCSTLARYPGDGQKDARLLRHFKTHGFTTDRQLAERQGC